MNSAAIVEGKQKFRQAGKRDDGINHGENNEHNETMDSQLHWTYHLQNLFAVLEHQGYCVPSDGENGAVRHTSG